MCVSARDAKPARGSAAGAVDSNAPNAHVRWRTASPTETCNDPNVARNLQLFEAIGAGLWGRRPLLRASRGSSLRRFARRWGIIVLERHAVPAGFTPRISARRFQHSSENAR